MPDVQGEIPERDQVRKILSTLPVEQSTALLLHSLEGYSYKEIAEIQGCSVTAVRSRLSRARKAFRDRYATTEALHPS
jgi:RNA polymerase sigma-70 factor, ECF subfamily